MKKIFLSLLLAFSTVLIGSDLHIFIDTVRFLDDTSNTELHINYQVPYKELSFEKQKSGYVSILQVEYSIIYEDSVLYKDDFTNKIILSNQEKTISDQSFNDKLTFTLSRSNMSIYLDFQDILSGRTKNWQYEFELLPRNSMLSGIEFSSQIVPDTSSYMKKFHRNGKLFIANPSHIFWVGNDISLYYEIQNYTRKDELFELEEIFSIFSDDELVRQFSEIITGHEKKIQRIRKLSTSNLPKGYYTMELSITDRFTGKKSDRIDSFFSLKQEHKIENRVMPNWEDEYILVQYFLSSQEKKKLRGLSEIGGKTYLDRFWASNDPNPVTKKNEFLIEIRDRVQYCNQHFSYFREGWKTDRGRIYIKNGSPDEIKKLRTSYDTSDSPAEFGQQPEYTKYTIKDYQIWIYRMKKNLSYIFLDFQANGNYRIIHSLNDDSEIGLANWKNYLGAEFDENMLR